MIGLLTALTLAGAAGMAVPPPMNDSFFSSPEVVCNGGATKVASTSGAAGFSRLGKLPNADMEIAVNRTHSNGCPAPMVVRYNVGH